jgi:hypothetical protein
MVGIGPAGQKNPAVLAGRLRRPQIFLIIPSPTGSRVSNKDMGWISPVNQYFYAFLSVCYTRIGANG